MRLRWMCRCTTRVGRIIRLTYGSTDGREAAWCSTSSWGAGVTVRRHFLGGFNGILQTDGYVAYDKIGGPELVHAACWAHSRRKFFEAHQVSPGESVAKGIVLLIDQLFGIDAEARVQNLDLAGRDQLRQQQARPLLEVIRQQIEGARGQALPASKLGGAIG